MDWDGTHELNMEGLESTTSEPNSIRDAEERQPLNEEDKRATVKTLSDIRTIALENLPKPRGKERFQKLTAKEIYELNKVNSVTRETLNNIAKICELMIQETRDNLLDLKHLAINHETGTITISYLKTIHLQYIFPPIMVFDATIKIDLLRNVLPNLKIRYRKNVLDGPGIRRFQLQDTSLTYSTLKSSVSWGARLSLWVELCCKMHGDTGLLVPKFLRENLDEHCSKKVTIGHFGDLKGTNDFERVSALALASRPAINPQVAEQAAAIITGENITTLEGKDTWYPRQKSAIRYRESPEYGWEVHHECHPDRTVEAVRASVTEDTVEQALGRGRNVRRSTEQPLTEYILTNVPTKRLVDGVFKAVEFKAVTSWVVLLLLSGIWFSTESKGSGGLIHKFALGLKSQRLDTLLYLY